MADSEDPTDGDAKRLVCGVCEALLYGTYGSEETAEDAVDEHRRQVHPDLDQDEVVVVHVTSTLVDLEGEEGVVEIAKGAQQRLDEGEVGEGLGGLGA